MKKIICVVTIAAFLAGTTACEQAQQAIDTVDKAKVLKDDIQKKTNEVKKKALELIPGSSAAEGRGEKDKKDERRGGQHGDEKEGDD